MVIVCNNKYFDRLSLFILATISVGTRELWSKEWERSIWDFDPVAWHGLWDAADHWTASISSWSRVLGGFIRVVLTSLLFEVYFAMEMKTVPL